MNDPKVEPVIEEVVQAPIEPKPDTLSSREALQHALETNREPTQEKVARETPTAREVKAAVEIDPEPPAEFSAAGKKAWTEKNVTEIQKEFRRINDSRTQEIGRAQTEARTAREEAKKSKEFMDSVSPYIEARLVGEGVPKEKAAVDAIRLAHALRTDKAAAKIELEKLGFVFAPDGTQPPPKIDDSKITSLQATVNELVQDKRQQVHQQAAQFFGQVFSELSNLKTRTGQPVFPDLLDDSEAGMQLATRIGSRTRQPEFQQMVARRFPGSDYSVLVREAYVWEGGKVAGEPQVESPKNNQQHIQKARRAAASSPGGAVSRNGAESLVGKLGNRAALKKAIELNQEH